MPKYSPMLSLGQRDRLEKFLSTLPEDKANLIIVMMQEEDREKLKLSMKAVQDIIEELGGCRWMARRLKLDKG